MPDFYTALKQNGLGHMIPKHTKSRRYSQPSYSHRPTRIQQTMQGDWEYYKATVPPEFRGHSFIDAYKPMDRVEYKALHNHAHNVFDTAIKQLGQFARAGRW
jgi:hypothetical protein